MNIEKFRITLNSICILIVAIMAVLSFSWSFPKKEKDNAYDTATEYMRELHVSYQGVKSDLVDATQHYIDSVAPNSGLRALILVEKCEEYGIPISFILGQGELESHFGTKGLAYRTNSVWNVGAYDEHSLTDISHKYANPNDSVEPYLQLLDSNYLQDMQSILAGCRKEQMVAIRAIDSCFMEYRRKTQDYRVPTIEEQEIWKQLFNVWQ